MTQAEQKPHFEIDEPLQLSAPLALEWAGELCNQATPEQAGCAWYHKSWQVLRLLGVFQSIRSDDDFFMPQLTRLIAGGVRRILISGAADYALLARVASAANTHRPDIHVTVMDRCETPLRLNAWYGEHAGIKVETIRGDVLDYHCPESFDLVCTHSFICFFDQEDRKRLLQSWWECLKPGGRIMTAQRARTKDTSPIIRYSEAGIEALSSRAFQMANEHALGKDYNPEQVRQLAEGYGRNHWTFLVRTPEEIQNLFQNQGFEMEIFSPPGRSQVVNDTPGTPNPLGSQRWRILSNKPA